MEWEIGLSSGLSFRVQVVEANLIDRFFDLFDRDEMPVFYSLNRGKGNIVVTVRVSDISYIRKVEE